jgi:hypothetical protein
MKRCFAMLVLSLALTNAGLAQDNVIKIEVSAVKDAYANAPLCIPLSVPKEWAKFDVVNVSILIGQDASAAIGQLTAPGIVTESVKPAAAGLVRRDLHLALPSLPLGKTATLKVSFKNSDLPAVPRFAWTEKKGEYAELSLANAGALTPFLRYMDRPYDTSSKDARDKSYKVFHHLYDPAGKRFVTNGGFVNDNVTDPKKLLYPHHRGIMYGFNKCSYGPDLKNKADTWHCTGDAHVAHEKTLSAETGTVLGRHRLLLGWFGEKNERFAQEERELTVYRVPGGTLVEFASRLTPTTGKIRVDGDPQHAGFQFRAANDVADKKIAAQTYFLHPDGKGKPGETRNWDPKTKVGPVDLPWYAMSFVLDGQRYSVCYLNHPSNPKETRFSERDYGRIGGYFQRDVTAQEPLVVNYRLWLQTGDISPERAVAQSIAFAAPPQTSVQGESK